jgi:hypothetical protein
MRNFDKASAATIAVIIVVVLLIAAGGIWYYISYKPQPKACTLEAKLCPDGSYVSRTGPNCEFAECPIVEDQFKDWKTYTNEKYGFEIKYPPQFKQISSPYLVAFGEYDAEKNLKGYVEFSVIVLDKNNSCDAVDYFNHKIKGEFVTGEEIKLLDENARVWKVQYTMLAPESITEKIYISRENCAELGIRELIVFNGGCGPLHPESCLETTTNQILSTFKFIEKDETDTDLSLAHEALIQYFSLLNKGQYAEAVKYHGSGYDYLRDWNPTIDPNDYINLLKNGCEINGLQCLKIKSVLNQQKISSTEFKFTVQFSNNNGTLFKRGPCCGATEETMPTKTEFEYTVKKIDNEFLVKDQPLYVP